jgi:hypothetical protein
LLDLGTRPQSGEALKVMANKPKDLKNYGAKVLAP